MHYRTEFEIWGLPLIEVKTGPMVNGRYQRGIARAWIAIGDVAFGMLVSVGGVAVGGIAVGGLSLGVLGLGGLALGGLVLGGCAIGIWAIGGAAIGLKLALGGLAVSGDVALGGVAIAPHANPPGGAGFELPFSQRFSKLQTPARMILFALPLVLLFVLSRARSRDEPPGSPRSPHR